MFFLKMRYNLRVILFANTNVFRKGKSGENWICKILSSTCPELGGELEFEQ